MSKRWMLLALLTALLLTAVSAQAAGPYLWPFTATMVSKSFAAGSHNGIDVMANAGEEVRAPAAGVLLRVFTGCARQGGLKEGVSCRDAGICSPNHDFYSGTSRVDGYCNLGFGNGVILRTDDGRDLLLPYLSAVCNGLTEGQQVTAGQVVGYVGSSGCCTGVHAHLGLCERWDTSPISYLDPMSVSYRYSLDDQAPVIGSISITNVTSAGFDAACRVTDDTGVARVLFAVWTDADALPEGWMDDPLYAGKLTGDTAVYHADTIDHGCYAGAYHIMVCAWDEAGNQCSARAEATVPASAAHTLTIACDEGGSIIAPAIGSHRYGDVVQISAAAAPGYVFEGWSCTAGAIGSAGDAETFFIMPDAAAGLHAHFRFEGLKLKAMAYDGGAVQPSVLTGRQAGEVVSIEAIPQEGWRFDHWVCNGAVLTDPASAATQVRLTGDADEAVCIAVFTCLDLTTWSVSDELPAYVTPELYEIEYRLADTRTASMKPGTGWIKTGVAGTGYIKIDEPYETARPQQTGDTCTLLDVYYYHYCRADKNNWYSTGYSDVYHHRDELRDMDAVTIVAVNTDSAGTEVYQLAWLNGQLIYCKPGVTCTDGDHGERCCWWYKGYLYQDWMPVTLYQWRIDTGWLTEQPNEYNQVRFRRVYARPASFDLVIPASTVSIEAEAFLSCTGVTSILIADGCTSIGSKAFAVCTKLTAAVIPATVTSIADDAFERCSTVIFGAPDSAAERYAREHQLVFVAE